MSTCLHGSKEIFENLFSLEIKCSLENLIILFDFRVMFLFAVNRKKIQK